MKFLKNHPFAVEAFFEHSLVLTFAVPKEQLQKLIPECLTLDTFQNHWAFIVVALVQTKQLRPKGFPRFLGSNFFLIGYRIFVRYENKLGKNLRGLYILKSETDSKRMEVLGNIFTHYNYSTIDIERTFHKNVYTIQSKQSNFAVEVNSTKENINLPQHSPFNNWKEARRFAGPLPFTFTYDKAENEMLIIQGVRQNWQPQPVQIDRFSFDFVDHFEFSKIVLANAFEVKNVPYYWKRGKIEKLVNQHE